MSGLIGVFLVTAALGNPTPSRTNGQEAVALLQEFCVDCHGEEKPKAKFALHDINPDISGGRDIERWEKILEMVSIGDMPPEEESQPTREQRAQLQDWLSGELLKIGRGPSSGLIQSPSYGNRVDHEALFSGEHKGPAFTRPRVWRISPSIYQQFARDVDMYRKLTAPLRVADATGFHDYAKLVADEATIRTMLQNAKRVATTLVHGPAIRLRGKASEGKSGLRRNSRHQVLAQFAKGIDVPSRQELDEVVRYAIQLLFHRPPTPEDRSRYLEGFLLPQLKETGRETSLQGMLVAMMLSPEFLYRMELGLGEELPDGRRMLSPRELAIALSLAVFDYHDPSLLKAAEAGRLSTRQDAIREFRRVLQSPDKKVRGAANKTFWIVSKSGGKTLHPSHPRLLRFFREFFGYTRAPDVFKDDTRHDGKHDAWQLVKDADWFILRVLKDDHRVLEQLLTGDQYYIHHRRTRKPGRYMAVYNLSEEDWVRNAITSMPEGQRSGILTHPAWLVAHSGNFENDPVRRGKWIQEHLLAGIVPDIPIGVEAQLPEEPHRTLRERFDVVRKAECWRCHKKMNPLGDPFEAYDDFGRFRKDHLIDKDQHVMATEFEAYSRLRKSQQPRRSPPETFTTRPVNTTGTLSGTADTTLDGPVSGPIDLCDRLARSDRARQSFIRHVFRYWMGRNETLNDSPTLMAMDKAYRDSEGSFQELLVSLISSDSFLYRK